MFTALCLLVLSLLTNAALGGTTAPPAVDPLVEPAVQLFAENVRDQTGREIKTMLVTPLNDTTLSIRFKFCSFPSRNLLYITTIHLAMQYTTLVSGEVTMPLCDLRDEVNCVTQAQQNHCIENTRIVPRPAGGWLTRPELAAYRNRYVAWTTDRDNQMRFKLKTQF